MLKKRAEYPFDFDALLEEAKEYSRVEGDASFALYLEAAIDYFENYVGHLITNKIYKKNLYIKTSPQNYTLEETNLIYLQLTDNNTGAITVLDTKASDFSGCITFTDEIGKSYIIEYQSQSNSSGLLRAGIKIGIFKLLAALYEKKGDFQSELPRDTVEYLKNLPEYKIRGIY